MSRNARVVIVGFMGAGKTTLARELARLRGCRAVDLDELVAAREGRDPRRLIEEDGEAAFREAETRALREALESAAAQVIALGGGAWTLERNRALVAASGYLTVWLDAPFELCWRRITEGGMERPLARDRESARGLYEERLASYRLADLRLRVGEEDAASSLAARVAGALTEFETRRGET